MTPSLRTLLITAGLSLATGLSLAAAPQIPSVSTAANAQPPISAPAKKKVKKHGVKTAKKARTTRAGTVNGR